MKFTFTETLVALVFCYVLMFFTYKIWDGVTCSEWRTTGATTCVGSEGYLRCEPERECIRRNP